MLKKRIIPVVLLRNGTIVQSRLFKRYQMLGVPSAVVRRLSSWSCDELIYLNISRDQAQLENRKDLNYPEITNINETIEIVCKECMMPLTFGGGIRTIEDIRYRLSLGVDKVTLNTAALESPDIIYESAKLFGSQCIVVSIDVKKDENNIYNVVKKGNEFTNLNVFDWMLEVQSRGAGEILLNSVDRDGTGVGFDIDLMANAADAVTIPLIAVGGAGEWSHFEEVLKYTKVSAVAAANIFQHSENSVYNLKKYLFSMGYNVRKPLKLSEEKLNL